MATQLLEVTGRGVFHEENGRARVIQDGQSLVGVGCLEDIEVEMIEIPRAGSTHAIVAFDDGNSRMPAGYITRTPAAPGGFSPIWSWCLPTIMVTHSWGSDLARVL